MHNVNTWTLQSDDDYGSASYVIIINLSIIFQSKIIINVIIIVEIVWRAKAAAGSFKQTFDDGFRRRAMT